MIDLRPHLQLYHYTTTAAAENILKTQEFWPSSWNIQGNKKLKNIRYVYFTPLKKITTVADLASIAMSPNRKLHYLRDGAQSPSSLPANWKSTTLAQDILELEVYWSAPEKRDHVIAVHIDTTLLAPHHIWRHDMHQIWYEVACPDILRVGVNPGINLQFDSTRRIGEQSGLRRFSYMVIGDATTLDGLGAPLDEEDTSQKFKIHDIGVSPLEFWFSNANADHYSPITLDEQEFEKP